MKTIYLDCSMGAAGDMLTAALLELHDNPASVLETLNRAFEGRAVLTASEDRKCGILGTHLTVSIDGSVEGEHSAGEEHRAHHHHTSLREVREFISGLPLPEQVIQDALSVYDLIAQAEAAVHGRPMENIHFHEVGSLDAMADVVSVCFLMHELAPDRVLSSPIHVGSGTVHCAHGELPVPAPATLELLKGIPTYGSSIRGELCTPTGAALLRHFVSEFGNMPLMCVRRVGYGTGFRDYPRANVVRALLGETDGAPEQIIELSCNLDDMTAEEIAEKALRIGKDCEIICLTGGEPLLQTDDHLVEVLHQAGFSVHVETNGTQELPEFEIIDWITLSPKEDFVTHAKVIIEAQSEVKLVFREAAGEADRNLREAQIERWAKLSAEDHSLQPCDTGDPARNAELLAETIDYILRHPWWRLSLQTHKLLNIR